MTDEADALKFANQMIGVGDILRAAVRLIEEHGDDAVAYAEARAGKSHDAGDAKGEEMWMQLRKLLVKLTSEDRPSDISVH